MSFSTALVVATLSAEAGALVALTLGARLVGRTTGPPLLRRLGETLHRQKMRSLDRVWPLTRLRRALGRADARAVQRIVTALIALKSAVCFPAGLVAIVWLPFAAFLVPSIVAAHDWTNAALQRWSRGVATWQVTSHVLAAAPGFVLAWFGPLRGEPLGPLALDHAAAIAAALLLSGGCAVVAGRLEADGLLKHWD